MSDFILTAEEGANFLRTEADNEIMLMLLPLADQYLLSASGHDWAADEIIHPSAKLAAGMLLVYWYDNVGAIGQPPDALTPLLVQLEAEALKYRKVTFMGLSGAGGICLPQACLGDVVLKVIGTYGKSGDQSAKFEAVISVAGLIMQTSAENLYNCLFTAVLKHPAEDVNA